MIITKCIVISAVIILTMCVEIKNVVQMTFDLDA